MKTDIRMIAFDLDGTLLTEEKILTPRTAEVLRRASSRGIELLATTGRALSGIPDAVKILDGANYALTANGAGVYRRKDGILDAWKQTLSEAAAEGLPSFELDSEGSYDPLFENLMDRERTLALMDELSALDVMPDPFIDGSCYMIAEKAPLVDRMDVTDSMKDYIRSSRTLISDMKSFLSDKTVQKITINFAGDENGHRIDLQKVLDILNRYPEFTAVTGGIRNIEVSDRLATKGDAMLQLASSLRICPEQIIAFGDSENDITMLQKAGTGVAMENSLEITKKAADAITLSNEEEGVAAYLEEKLGF
ncbi:MAG: HAD hydrolase family protein [Eubacterium sp.]|nr:HAD hydrolase family protein [Eubacterium sp.]